MDRSEWQLSPSWGGEPGFQRCASRVVCALALLSDAHSEADQGNAHLPFYMDRLN